MSGFETNRGISAETATTMLDLNGDGKANIADLQLLLKDLKAGAGGTVSVPEPATFELGVMTAVVLMIMGIKVGPCNGV
jgi:hypothetical protein